MEQEGDPDMNQAHPVDVKGAITAEFLALAAVLEGLGEEGWDAPSLCAGWRVREVVAHMTMPVRYSTEQFVAELRACDGDSTRLSNLVASRDASLPARVLVGNLRDPVMHEWEPPAAGAMAALNHVVIHGLDITVALGGPRVPPGETVRVVLDDLCGGGTHRHFGFDLEGLELRATDLDWAFGEGTPVVGAAGDLALFMTGRQLPAGRIHGV
jgi:uncharacterized protein (TIGR03083 family)